MGPDVHAACCALCQGGRGRRFLDLGQIVLVVEQSDRGSGEARGLELGLEGDGRRAGGVTVDAVGDVLDSGLPAGEVLQPVADEQRANDRTLDQQTEIKRPRSPPSKPIFRRLRVAGGRGYAASRGGSGGTSRAETSELWAQDRQGLTPGRESKKTFGKPCRRFDDARSAAA